MYCIKTGCVAYLEEYGAWCVGDLFQISDVYIYRYTGIFYGAPPREQYHLIINNIRLEFSAPSVVTLIFHVSDAECFLDGRKVPE